MIWPNHIRMSNPEFPLWSPNFPHRIGNRSYQFPWSLPQWLKFVLHCFNLRVPQPHLVPHLECSLNPSSSGPIVGLLTLLACVPMQLIPHHWRTAPQLVGRSKYKRTGRLFALLRRREWGVIVDLHCPLYYPRKILGFLCPHSSQTVQQCLVEPFHKSNRCVVVRG